jgi:hypothetical protein
MKGISSRIEGIDFKDETALEPKAGSFHPSMSVFETDPRSRIPNRR